MVPCENSVPSSYYESRLSSVVKNLNTSCQQIREIGWDSTKSRKSPAEQRIDNLVKSRLKLFFSDRVPRRSIIASLSNNSEFDYSLTAH